MMNVQPSRWVGIIKEIVKTGGYGWENKTQEAMLVSLPWPTDPRWPGNLVKRGTDGLFRKQWKEALKGWLVENWHDLGMTKNVGPLLTLLVPHSSTIRTIWTPATENTLYNEGYGPLTALEGPKEVLLAKFKNASGRIGVFRLMFKLLVKIQGKVKSKRLSTLVSSLKESALGPYGGGSYTSESGQTVALTEVSGAVVWICNIRVAQREDIFWKVYLPRWIGFQKKRFEKKKIISRGPYDHLAYFNIAALRAHMGKITNNPGNLQSCVKFSYHTSGKLLAR